MAALQLTQNILFFAHFNEQKKVSDSINIAFKNVHAQFVTASQIRSNVQILQNLICQDQAYLFLRQIPATPPYWQRFMYEVVVMVKLPETPSSTCSMLLQSGEKLSKFANELSNPE